MGQITDDAYSLRPFPSVMGRCCRLETGLIIKPVTVYLSTLLGKDVRFSQIAWRKGVAPGEVVLLETLDFCGRRRKCSPLFCTFSEWMWPLREWCLWSSSSCTCEHCRVTGFCPDTLVFFSKKLRFFPKEWKILNILVLVLGGTKWKPKLEFEKFCKYGG